MQKRWSESHSEETEIRREDVVVIVWLVILSVLSLTAVALVKCEPMLTRATCLWLLNNLRAIILKDILVHMSYHGLHFRLTGRGRGGY